uniref:Uncharacterized protein n=1 Tax=Rhizophora mucronata TaxID=61149 RepID=A0A2P2M4V3_RHIMU
MAMPLPPGNAVVSDKMSFSAGAGSGGGDAANEIHQRHQQQQQWFPLDERDGFISWLRGEFAAANAIIDSLCHHLQAVVGEPGEYELVIGAIQQRRCNWNPVLHMQQYFSVGEVIVALQQVALWRQQHHHQHHQQYRHYSDQSKVGGKQFRRSSGSGFNKELGGSVVGKDLIDSSLESRSLNGNSSGNVGNEKKLEEVKSGGGGDGGKLNKDKVLAPSLDEGTDATSRTDAGGDLKVSGNLEGNLGGNSEAEGVDDGSRHRGLSLVLFSSITQGGRF